MQLKPPNFIGSILRRENNVTFHHYYISSPSLSLFLSSLGPIPLLTARGAHPSCVAAAAFSLSHPSPPTLPSPPPPHTRLHLLVASMCAVMAWCIRSDWLIGTLYAAQRGPCRQGDGTVWESQGAHGSADQGLRHQGEAVPWRQAGGHKSETGARIHRCCRNAAAAARWDGKTRADTTTAVAGLLVGFVLP